MDKQKIEPIQKEKWFNLVRRESLYGFLFTTPFIIGFLLFFLFPFIISIMLAFGKLVDIKGMKIELIGMANFSNVLSSDSDFIGLMVKTLRESFTLVPLTVVFAFVIAIMLTKKIKGNWFFRSAFFIPFMLGSGYVLEQLINQGVNTAVLNIDMAIIIPKSAIYYLGGEVLNLLNSFLGNVVMLLWKSSVQIILFISGLHAIPASCYEAARVEGANEWETFWKITIPMVSPITFLNIIYTIIVSFNDLTNPVLMYVKRRLFATNNLNFEYGAAAYWIYTLVILIVIIVAFILFSRMVKIRER